MHRLGKLSVVTETILKTDKVNFGGVWLIPDC